MWYGEQNKLLEEKRLRRETREKKDDSRKSLR